MPEVFVNAQGPWPIPRTLLLMGCRTTLAREGLLDGEISVTLLDDRTIGTLNQEYFGRDGPTDVIAFALHEEGEPLLGDVYVGFEQAARQARDLDIGLEEELLRLTVHGVLHVLGYRHPEGEDRFESEMFHRQEELVRKTLESAAK